MEHTPLPWELEENGSAFNLKQKGMPHHMILLGMTYSPPLNHVANVELIIRSVNSHDDLLEALRKIANFEKRAYRIDDAVDIAQAAVSKIDAKFRKDK